MLVTTMDAFEVLAEVKKDFDKLYATTIRRLANEYDRERRKCKIDKKRTYTKLCTVKTARKNNWIIVIGKTPSIEKYADIESVIVTSVTYYYDEVGLVALMWSNPAGIQSFNGHFFNRYNERLQLGLTSPIEIVKHYFKHNRYSHARTVRNDGINHIIGFSKEGILLGEMGLMGLWLEWRTFVSRDLMKHDQDAMEEKLFDDLEELIKKGELASTDKLSLLRGQVDKIKAIREEFSID